MPDPNLPKKIAKDLSIDNLVEVKRLYQEQIKKEASKDQRYELIEQVAESLNHQFNHTEQLDSLSDPAFLNYFYLIACSDEYKELLSFLDPKLPIDYEALLFKAIELQDAETVNHLISCKPELLNIRLKKPFASTKMKDYLLRAPWCQGIYETLNQLKLSSEMEPICSEDLPCFEEIEKALKKKMHS